VSGNLENRPLSRSAEWWYWCLSYWDYHIYMILTPYRQHAAQREEAASSKGSASSSLDLLICAVQAPVAALGDDARTRVSARVLHRSLLGNSTHGQARMGPALANISVRSTDPGQRRSIQLPSRCTQRPQATGAVAGAPRVLQL
jgi:hypothetical protein